MKKITLFLLVLLILLPSCQKKKEETKVYTFRQGNTEIAIDAEAKPILQALGSPKATEVKPSCLFGDENDVLYRYAGFELMTYVDEKGVERIYNVDIIDDSVGTAIPEGIGVGSAKAEVLSKLGTPTRESNGNLLYEADGMGLYVFLQDERVRSISYRKTES